MIKAHQHDDGSLTLVIEELGYTDAKQLANLIGGITGRGQAEGVISGQRVRVVIVNEGTAVAQHSAIDEH